MSETINHAAKVREARDVIAKAKAKLKALCDGTERWHMSIPARPDDDPDLVIFDGLHHAEEALSHLDALEAELQSVKCAYDDATAKECVTYDALTTRIAELEAALAKVIAHTGLPSSPGIDLLLGLIASIDRIARAALTDRGASGGEKRKPADPLNCCADCQFQNPRIASECDECGGDRNPTNWQPKPTPSGAEETTR